MARSTNASIGFLDHETTALRVNVSGTTHRLATPRKNSGALFMVIALGLAAGVPTAQGQEISFLREFSISDWGAAHRVVVDTSGIYVGGGGSGGIFVRKYSASGNELWTRQIPATNGGWTTGMAVDANGVYVVSSTRGKSSVHKYDTSGNELWARPISPSQSADATGAAADATGLYVAGGLGQLAFLRKYDSSGTELWTRQSSSGIYYAGVAADSTGVYLVGNIVDGRITHGLVRKYTAGGEEVWTRQFLGANWARGVAVDTTGVYVVASSSQLFLRKYDSSGNESWTREFDKSSVTPVSSDDYVDVTGVAADPSGVYLVGATSFALAGQCRSGFQDAFVRKYDADGVSVWTRQFSASSDYGSGSGVAVDATGVYVAGQSTGPPGSKALLAKLEKTQPAINESVPRIFPGCVVNAASDIGGRVSPGEIVTILGRGIGPLETAPLLLTEQHRLATTLAGTRILFNGIPAPLISVAADRATAIIPYVVAERSTVDVQVDYQGVLSNVVTMPVAPVRPGIFTVGSPDGRHAAALNEDGSINSSSTPATLGSVIVLFATGEGLTEPVVEDGLVLGSMLPKPRLPVSVVFSSSCSGFYCYYYYYGRGPESEEALYAGGAPGLVAGVLQVNVRIPRNASDEVKLCIDDQCTEFTRVFIKH
ncbi:MAG TPA: hypothetical protein VLE22_24450 [Bryobacteraceae bacterium]|nr:hypothetical protein [Bryobacteraceae bacterium]